jgi:adenylate kinase family enzyme
MMSNDLVNKLEEVVWSRIIENIRDLGQVLMIPGDYTDITIKKRLDRASCTAAWVSLLKDKDLVISDLIPDAHDLLTYLHDLVKDKKYEDGQSLIRVTELDKIVRPDPSIKFPEGLIPVFEVILKTYFKTYYLVG